MLWFIPVYSMNLQPFKDPFDSRGDGGSARRTPMERARIEADLMVARNFQSAVEAQIGYIVTTPANAQVKDPRVKSIGPWDYGQLDHAGRRGVRGAGACRMAGFLRHAV